MNTITIQLCAEDRARLDHIIEGLRFLVNQQAEIAPTEEPQLEPVTEELQPEHIKEETPTVTAADLQTKVVSLVQSGKKDEVKDIITAYAPRVGEIPEDKLAEVMDKLKALEG